jgi:hypothetical protein
MTTQVVIIFSSNFVYFIELIINFRFNRGTLQKKFLCLIWEKNLKHYPVPLKKVISNKQDLNNEYK